MPFDNDADGIFDAVKGYVERGLKPFVARLFDLEKKVAALPLPVDGKDGRDGIDGKDGAPGPRGADGVGVIGPVGPQGIPGRDGKDATGRDGKDGERGPQGERGQDGKDGERGPQGERGQDGKDGANGINGKDGAPGLAGKDGAPGVDGKNIDLAETKRIVLTEWVPILSKAVADIPKPKDGKDGADGSDGEPGESGRDGRDGKDGPRGRDALQIEPLPGIDVTRSYPRGTYALEAGGMLRAMRTTDPVADAKYEEAGWQVVWNGIRPDGIKLVDCRTLVFAMTAGVQKMHVPMQIYRGVFREQEYEEGDTVTSGGSNWHANRITRSRPGIDDSWTLMTKRGSDGKDGR